MIQLPWLERSWHFDFPVGVFPGIVERLRGTPARIAELIAGVPHTSLIRRRDERWSVNQHIGHLIDLDELDHARLDNYIAGAQTLSAWDGTNRRTDEAGYNDAVAVTILDFFNDRRLDLVRRLEALDDDVIGRVALHPRLKLPMRLVDWTYFVAEHDDHHLARMRELIRTPR